MTHPAASTQHTSNVLLVNLQDGFDSLDPALGYQAYTWQLEFATCAKLMNYPDGPWSSAQQPEPEIAVGPPTISADGRTYSFKLHEHFRFSPPSTEKVTAQSFKVAVERLLARHSDSPGIG